MKRKALLKINREDFKTSRKESTSTLMTWTKLKKCANKLAQADIERFQLRTKAGKEDA